MKNPNTLALTKSVLVSQEVVVLVPSMLFDGSSMRTKSSLHLRVLVDAWIGEPWMQSGLRALGLSTC